MLQVFMEIKIKRNYLIMVFNYKKNKKLDSCMDYLKNNSRKHLKQLVN